MSEEGFAGEAVPPRDEEQLRADIELTRQELGDTVQALADRANVSRRMHEGVAAAQVKARNAVPPPLFTAGEQALSFARAYPLSLAGVVALLAFVRFTLRRRRTAARGR